MPGSDLVLSVYLNDHHAAAVLAAELGSRLASQRRGSQDAAEFTALADDLAEDLRSLRTVMADLDIAIRRYKATAAWIGEKLGRLKLNGRVLSPSPSSPVVELDALAMLIAGKSAVWRSLLTLARHDGRLDERGLIELDGRANRQADTVRRLHVRYAEAAFVRAKATETG